MKDLREKRVDIIQLLDMAEDLKNGEFGKIAKECKKYLDKYPEDILATAYDIRKEIAALEAYSYITEFGYTEYVHSLWKDLYYFYQEYSDIKSLYKMSNAIFNLMDKATK